MTQEERLDYLIKTLATEQPRYAGLELPADREEKRAPLRGALFNLRPPLPADERRPSAVHRTSISRRS